MIKREWCGAGRKADRFFCRHVIEASIEELAQLSWLLACRPLPAFASKPEVAGDSYEHAHGSSA